MAMATIKHKAGVRTIQISGALGTTLPSAEETTFGYIRTTETVTEEVPSGKCWFNGVLLPEIPEDVLAEYPYAWIRKDTGTGYYELFMATGKWYKWVNDSGAIVFGHDDSNNIKWYRIGVASAESAEAWTYYQDYSANNFGAATEARSVVWSNHDIPNGSADATEIYLEGSKPVEELKMVTNTIIHHDPVERESGYSITRESMNEIAKRTQEMAGTSKLMTPEEIAYWLGRVMFIPQGYAASTVRLTELEVNGNSSGIVATVYRGTASGELVLPEMICNGSASGVLEE